MYLVMVDPLLSSNNFLFSSTKYWCYLNIKIYIYLNYDYVFDICNLYYCSAIFLFNFRTESPHLRILALGHISNGHGLLLVLCLGITSGGDQGTIYDDRDQISIRCMNEMQA